MAKKQTLGRKISALNKKRKWTIYRACSRMPNVGRNALTRIVDGTADTNKITVGTMFELLEAYRPDLKFSDFRANQAKGKKAGTKCRKE